MTQRELRPEDYLDIHRRRWVLIAIEQQYKELTRSYQAER